MGSGNNTLRQAAGRENAGLNREQSELSHASFVYCTQHAAILCTGVFGPNAMNTGIEAGNVNFTAERLSAMLLSGREGNGEVRQTCQRGVRARLHRQVCRTPEGGPEPQAGKKRLQLHRAQMFPEPV